MTSSFDARVTRSLIPLVRGFAGEIASEAAGRATDDAERQALMGALAAARFSKKKPEEFERSIPDLMRILPALSGWLASAAGAAALDLRARQEQAAGLDEESYDEMVQAVMQLGVTSAIYRVAVPQNGSSSELAIAGAHGFQATVVDDDAQYVDVLRLAPWLAAVKLGQDISLALFVAYWINSHYPGSACAFPCARMGGREGPEIDVAIPLLSTGIEVKLYQAPGAVVPSKLETYAGDLAKQLPDYFNLGCDHVIVLTNLAPADASGLAERLTKVPALSGKNLRVVGGRLDGLLPLLNEIVAKLQPHVQRELGFP